MRIFGRKANVQSQNLPPELAPYYKPSLRQELTHTGLLILPFLVVLVVLGGLIWGGWELFHRTRSTESNSSRTQTAQNGDQKNPSSSGKTSSPAPTTSPTPSSSANQGSGSSTESTPPTADQGQVQQPAQQTTPQLTNTGPDATVVEVAASMAVIAATIWEIRQQRAARQ